MSMLKSFLALDLGAESGRAVLGRFDGEQVHRSEGHRFPNIPVYVPQRLLWDTLRLWSKVKQGVALTARQEGPGRASVGLDAWGVDLGDSFDLSIHKPEAGDR